MFDKLKIYYGSDIPITSKIVVKQPTLEQIMNFGEKEYFAAVQTLTSVGADMKAQLWDEGIDYTKIDDYDLFIKLIWHIVGSQKRLLAEAQQTQEGEQMLSQLSQEDIEKLSKNPLELVLNIDLGDFAVYEEKKDEDSPARIILYNRQDDITIDRAVYTQLIDVVRMIHGFKRNNELPANEKTKLDLIEDAKDELEATRYKEYQSVLRPLVSYFKINNGLCGSKQVWQMKVNEFFYDLKKSGNLKETELLLQGAYSGFASLKGVSNEKLNWFSDVM